MLRRSALLSLGLTLLRPAAAPAQTATPAEIRTAAADVIRTARYCTLITIGEDGQPQARIVDPLLTGDSLVVWIGTNPLTRKVTELKRDPRVTLLFFNPAAGEYVTLLGRAVVVTDSARRAGHWKPEWAPFYRDTWRGADFLLLEVRPFRLEVVSPRHRLINDPRTWRPIILDLP